MIRVSKAPLALRSYHILLLQMYLHINIWYRAGASHHFDTLILKDRKSAKPIWNILKMAFALFWLLHKY